MDGGWGDRGGPNVFFNPFCLGVFAPLVKTLISPCLCQISPRAFPHPQLPTPRGFRLFLHTKLSNPHYPPEVQAETTLINFTVTEQVIGTLH